MDCGNLPGLNVVFMHGPAWPVAHVWGSGTGVAGKRRDVCVGVSDGGAYRDQVG